MIPRLLTLLLGLTACDRVAGPVLPAGSVPFDPPARYQQWWNMVQACSGLTGDFRTLRWLQVPGATNIAHDPKIGAYNGIWYRRNNTIVLAEAAVLNGHVVRHEMLHALLRAEGHPREQFQANCGGIVSCNSTCEQDGGGRFFPQAGAPVLTSDKLGLQLQFYPATNAGGADAGAVSVVVSATSPRDEAVWVTLSLGTFSVRVERQDGPEVFARTAQSSAAPVAFEASGRRQHAFDLELPGGLYAVTGFFDRTAAPVLQYRVEP